MKKAKEIAILFLAAGFLFCSCNYGQLGSADRMDTYYPGDALFEECMDFLAGIWYSHYAGIGRLDGYRIRKWGDFSSADKTRAETMFPALDSGDPQTCSSRSSPKNSDYVILYDDTAYGQEDDDTGGGESWGFGYMGLVRAINIFNGDKGRGAIIIEYFEEADPAWLWNPDNYFGESQGLARGEKPFFGVYYRVLSLDIVQLANAADLAATYAGKPYYTETGTLEEAVEANSVENEAELISWGTVTPQDREK